MEAARLFLEPITRAALEAEGVSRSLPHTGLRRHRESLLHSRWNGHYMSPGALAIDNIREAEAKPLTKDTFKAVLNEMSNDAG